MSQTRDEVIRYRLNKMTKWAAQRREFLANLPEDWPKDRYIRIGGNGFTAVSLNHDRPLLGFDSGTVKSIETVKGHFSKSIEGKPGKPTPERHVQCWLIKQAINHQLDLKGELCPDDSEYDELLFALDEVSFGDKKHPQIMRCDILAVGVHHGNNFPVLIELKSSHYLDRPHGLLGQLQDYQDGMKKFKPQIETLLKNCVNKKVDFSKCGKIIIWPRLSSGKVSNKTFDKCKEESVGIIQYTWNHNANIENIKFETYPGLKLAP